MVVGAEVSVALKDGDLITFGTGNATYAISVLPLGASILKHTHTRTHAHAHT